MRSRSGAGIKNMEGVVKDGKIVQYRVNANITFELAQ
jgi:flavin-binding protein dodecin